MIQKKSKENKRRMNVNSKVIYGIFIIAVIFFIVTVSILGFSKCSEDEVAGPAMPTATPGFSPDTSATQGTTPTTSASAASTPTATPTIDPYATPTPSPVPSHIIDKTVTAPVKKKYYIEVSLKAQIVYVYNMTEEGGKGELVRAMICSSGRSGDETPTGVWVILENNIKSDSRYVWRSLFNNVYGHYATRMFKVSNYGQSNESNAFSHYLFHSVPYGAKENDALKWQDWNMLGTPASDGCIRLAVEDSKWIYENVAAWSYVFTIEGVEDPLLWEALKRKDIDASCKYDPTDYDYISTL